MQCMYVDANAPFLPYILLMQYTMLMQYFSPFWHNKAKKSQLLRVKRQIYDVNWEKIVAFHSEKYYNLIITTIIRKHNYLIKHYKTSD